jgi:hypothetical protein
LDENMKQDKRMSVSFFLETAWLQRFSSTSAFSKILGRRWLGKNYGNLRKAHIKGRGMEVLSHCRNRCEKQVWGKEKGHFYAEYRYLGAAFVASVMFTSRPRWDIPEKQIFLENIGLFCRSSWTRNWCL